MGVAESATACRTGCCDSSPAENEVRFSATTAAPVDISEVSRPELDVSAPLAPGDQWTVDLALAGDAGGRVEPLGLVGALKDTSE